MSTEVILMEDVAGLGDQGGHGPRAARQTPRPGKAPQPRAEELARAQRPDQPVHRRRAIEPLDP